MKKTRIPDGAWEEKGVVGSRIEIEGKKLTVLWRGGPVLETRFAAAEEDGKILLVPEENEMRYTPGGKPYGTVTRLEWQDGNILFTEHFPITGESSSLLSPTEKSRYGDVTIVDGEVLPVLKGKWEGEGGYPSFEIRGGVIAADLSKENIRAVRRNWDGKIELVSEDPSHDFVLGLSNIEVLDQNTISVVIPVCDAPRIPILVRRKKG